MLVVEKAAGRMQRALVKVERWAVRNKIGLNPEKSECCVFTKDRAEANWEPELEVCGSRMKMIQ